MTYKVLVFDWDGTLHNSGDHIITSFQSAAKLLNLLVPTADAIRNVIGLNFEKAVNALFPNLQTERMEEFKQAVRQSAAYYAPLPTLFPGAKDVLQQLQDVGYWLAVATGKGRDYFNGEIHRLGIKDFFMATRCGDETFSKPHPQMLLDIMETLGVEASNMLMIGDTEHDLLLAANAGVDALAVNYGLQAESKLLQHNIKGCLSDIRDLPAWLFDFKEEM